MIATRAANRNCPKLLLSLALLASLAMPAIAFAGEPEIAAPSPTPHIWNGADTEPCAWPSVVMVSGGSSLCTGTLIHPKVVMYAAHCGASDKVVRFGDSQNSAKTRMVEYCKTNPIYNGGQGSDWAYCVLQEEVFEIPFTPVGYGCEVEQHYANGAEIAIIGFGNNDGDNGAGRKRWGWTYISNASGSRFDVGGQLTESICSGDSGGPAMIRYEDGSWHVYGIASTKNDDTCTSAKGTHSLAVNAVEWIEQDSDIDVTVCHDLAGNWDPGPLCGNFFNGQPALSYGAWNTWCEDATALEWSATCGPDFGQNAEVNAPTLEVVVPFDGQVFDAEPAMFDIAVMAQDDSGLPVEVQIEVEGMLQGTPTSDNPAVFPNAVFYCGEYTITAHGTDFWGNVAQSEPVTFMVAGACNPGDGDPGDGDGDPGDGDGDGETESGGPVDTGDGDTGETGLDSGPSQDGPVDETGCACGVRERGPSGLPGTLALVALAGLGLIRRRAR
jgi:MYXO-CTERM domain-containing protein